MDQLLTPERLWNHWEGHRRLTLRALEAYPEDQLFSHSSGNMRSFGDLMDEIINVEDSIMEGMSSGEWKWEPKYKNMKSKAELLAAFEEVRQRSKELYPRISVERLNTLERDAWGAESPNLERFFYMIDNEIHHRGQGYVYMRQLGIEPPAFYVR
jgi:uncharacterized damage-inducible protein DinB